MTTLLRPKTTNKTGDAGGPASDVTGRRHGAGQFAGPAYLTAAIFIITATIDIVTLGMPANPGAVAWRFGTVGAASNYMMTAFFGAALACGTAVYYGHVRTLRVFSVLFLVGALLLMIVLVDFGLNVAQLRGSVGGGERAAFRIGTTKAAVKYGMTIIAFLALAVSSWRRAAAYRRANASGW